MEESRRRDEQNRGNTADADARPRATASALWTFAVPVVAFLVGLFTRGVGPGAHGLQRLGGDVSYERLVCEYDLITIRYVTPAAFETDVRELGVTDAEYRACKSSIQRAPHQKICTRPGVKCFKKKLIYERDASGDMQPAYVKRGATEVECPSEYGFRWLENHGRDLHYWPKDCHKRAPDGTPICYSELYCQEESTQWNFESDTTQNDRERRFVVNWRTGKPPHESITPFWHTADAPAWYGGLNPSNLTYPSSDSSLTTPYEGKFCLQKAALKAISRQGWELIEPDEAFKPSWHYDYRYSPAYRADIYAPKTFKVRRYSAM